jgi:transcriptional regulator with XRE-family HTH domain
VAKFVVAFNGEESTVANDQGPTTTDGKVFVRWSSVFTGKAAHLLRHRSWCNEIPLARRYYSGYYARHHWGLVLVAFSMNIGQTIRDYRLQRGMSQGDIEKRTGLLRCYLSRVENGHTIPSLDTLAKIAGAMEIALSQFFSESGHTNGSKNLPQLSDDEVRFLSQIRRYSVSLNDSDRKLVLAMVKKMATK